MPGTWKRRCWTGRNWRPPGRRMGERLVVLPGHIGGRTPVTRLVLPAVLRADLAAALPVAAG